ncbi:phosphoribosylglycinamide formyltransferase [Candidatus Palibaumannia cicadellinicola]|uniref:phosphoribosylglycinamide formyltransferase n=1 Tax=Candidatus Palibaumannia cicadellinicola TaxID=186490 RepID=UPI00059FF8F0|nr:phosphoribosylglycinamide formyltransferase [Candidatus Baumannia cicadellinicola]MBS0032609.1 phosphoribosylglycinamide formyltransferase [Candidatus Baumannia cicadellinicola]MCJ7462466.1 phosphoribosylglycinamide formyltransferase [Candidatus Baumannia cicadellinicola]MCJ7462657.1 phosphoribosylglycinamide formyltransferase [Candidatus Baumannia cicadellinicola]
MKRLVVLISGQGTNLKALIQACQQKKLAAQITAVLSNKANAQGLAYAVNMNIPIHTLDINDFTGSKSFDYALAAIIDYYQPDIVVLAGYMRILSAEFVYRYAGRLLNIHPSLLPLYPGLHTHRKALQNGDIIHGASVHFVTNIVDSGPVILQAHVPILSNDNEITLAQRVKNKEHVIYPLVISWLLAGRIVLQENTVFLDGVELPPTGYNTNLLTLS